MRKPIFVYGSSGTAYRPALILKLLAERKDIELIYFSNDWFLNLPPFLRSILRLATITLNLIGSQTVVIMPVSHNGLSPRYIFLLSKLLGKKVITDFYISNFETEVIDRKNVPSGSKQADSLRQCDRLAITNSSTVIFLNASERDYYCSVLGFDSLPSNTTIIPLVVPSRPQAATPYLSGKRSIPTFAWWGGIGNPIHGFDQIADAIRILQKKNIPFRIGLFGTNNRHYQRIREQHQDIADHPDVIFSHEYSFWNGRLTEFLENEADFALGTFGESQKSRTVIANKILDAASFALPCLTQESAGLLEYFKPGEHLLTCGINAEQIAAAMENMILQPSMSQSIGLSSHKLIGDVFSPEQFEKRLMSLI